MKINYMVESIRSNYIKEVKGNNIILGDVFNAQINFSEGLNIIAGTNGTGKTQLLKFIQTNRTADSIIFNSNDIDLKNIASFNPKRNSIKTLIEQAQRAVRRDSNAKQTAINHFLNMQIQDDNFQTMKSISEYLILAFEDLRDGENKQPIQAAEEISTKFTDLIKKIFDYKIKFIWDVEKREPDLFLIKDEQSLRPNQLSSGENALISLILAIFYSKDSTQVYLIDEPEVHLNWQLEEKLFHFLNWFSGEYKKQMIVATHSRACFIEPFLSKAQFLVWNDKKIEIIKRPNTEIKEFLAGDLVKIAEGITIEDKLTYVEDNIHKIVLNKIKECLNLKLEISKLGSCSEVQKFSKAMKMLKVRNVYFLIDNDNRKIENHDEYLNLIQLDKYCIENYFLDENILTKIDKRSDRTKSIKTLIIESIKQVKDPNFAIVKKLIDENIILTPEILDRIDASKFVNGNGNDLIGGLGFTEKEEFFNAYLEEIHSNGNLKDIFKDINAVLQ